MATNLAGESIHIDEWSMIMMMIEIHNDYDDDDEDDD